MRMYVKRQEHYYDRIKYGQTHIYTTQQIDKNDKKGV